MDNNNYYVQVDDDSYHFSTLQNILNIYEVSPEKLTKEYLIRGLCNSLKDGYEIKEITNNNNDVGDNVINNISDFIIYLSNKQFNINNILFKIKDTLNSGYDLSISKIYKIDVGHKTQKQIEDLLIKIKNGEY